MDMSGYSEKGFKRKLAVQALFGKVYYLSEVRWYLNCVFFSIVVCCFLLLYEYAVLSSYFFY